MRNGKLRQSLPISTVTVCKSFQQVGNAVIPACNPLPNIAPLGSWNEVVKLPAAVHPLPTGEGEKSSIALRHHWFTCTTLAGGKPLKDVLLAVE